MIRRIAAVFLALTVASCATPVTHRTASGKPEVTVATSDTDAVKGALISEMLNRGYTITRESDFFLSFDRPIDNILAAVLLGSQYDSTPSARIGYNIAQVENGIRLVGDAMIITNPGSAFERRTSMNENQNTLKIQEMMNQLKYEIENR